MDIIAGCSYKRLCFISKSLGTLFAGEATLRLEGCDIKHFYLTPVSRTLPYIRAGCFAVTGSDDPYLSAEAFNKIKEILGEELTVIEQADHSLETRYGLAANLDVLGRIMDVCELFLRK